MTMSTNQSKLDSNQCFRYNFALVSRIASSFADESSFLMKPGESIDIEKARLEQESLVDSLRRIGIDVIELPCDETHPDAIFVDDIAVIINGTALICNPPQFKDRPSRQGELAVVRQVLRREVGLKIVEVDTDSAHVEGGDVMWTGREIIVGIGERTNNLGAQSVARAFPEYPTVVVTVPKPAVHLKDCISMAGPDVMTISKSDPAQRIFHELQNDIGLSGYKYIKVDEPEAANVLYCNGNLLLLNGELIPKGFDVYENKLESPRICINTVEARKRGNSFCSCVLLLNKIKHIRKIPMTEATN